MLDREHPLTLESQYRLANAITDQHRYGEAERLYLETLAAASHAGSQPSVHCEYHFQSGPLASALGRRDEAFARLREAVDHGLAPSQALAIETNDSLKPLRGARVSRTRLLRAPEGRPTPH